MAKSFLNEVFNFVPTGAAAEHYIGVVLEKYQLRKLKQLCEEISEKCDNPKIKSDDLLTETQTKFDELTKVSSIACAPIPFKELVDETFEWIEGLYNNPPASIIRFGIDKLDRALLPIEPGSQIIIGGATSSGKTALALQAVLHSTDRAFGIFSLEMPCRQLMARMFASQGQIDLANLRQGRMTNPEGARLPRVCEQLRERKEQIYIEDRPLDVRSIGAKSRLWKQNNKLDAIIVDYLQLITPAAHKRDNSREREVAEISRSLKILARELGVAVIALSQLNEQGQLRESRAIGQDGDVVVQIEEDDDGESVIRVKKNRNGSCTIVPVTFNGKFQRFTEARSDPSPVSTDSPEPVLDLFKNGNGRH